MTARAGVRSHSRRTASGRTTTVRQHSRRTRGRRALVSPGHAWKLARRAFGAARKRRRAVAVVLGVLAVAELAAWLTLDTTALMLATAAALAIGGATVAAAMTGRRL